MFREEITKEERGELKRRVLEKEPETSHCPLTNAKCWIKQQNQNSEELLPDLRELKGHSRGVWFSLCLKQLYCIRTMIFSIDLLVFGFVSVDLRCY